MGEHKVSQSQTLNVPRLAQSILRGMSLGLIVGILLIGVGIVRGAIFMLSGGHLAQVSAADLRAAIYYLAGFSLAGAIAGAVLPSVRTRMASYLTFATGGIVVMLAIAASDKGGLTGQRAIDWLFLIPLGALLGVAFGYGWSRRA